jgi:hypothetical protein
MKKLKISIELEFAPAIGFMIGVDGGSGLVILLPFLSLIIKRVKPFNSIKPVR